MLERNVLQSQYVKNFYTFYWVGPLKQRLEEYWAAFRKILNCPVVSASSTDFKEIQFCRN